MLKFFSRFVLVLLLLLLLLLCSFLIPLSVKCHSDENFSLSQVTGLQVYMNNTSSTLTWNEVINSDGYEIELTSSGEKHFYDVTANVLVLSSDLGNNFKVRAYKYVEGKKIFGEYSSPYQS